VQKRCERNRKRSQRRAIYCPVHACYLDSVSPKFPLYADTAGQLQVRGIGSRAARLAVATYGVVPLTGEWIEAFWCHECQSTEWYHVKKVGERAYEIRKAPRDLWQNATGVVDPHQNPTVSEFSFRASRGYSPYGRKGFRALG
jgi:hypothetical protein